MGELLLCKSQMAEHPFYIESGSCNVYSVEELCYFMEQYTYLLDNDFMSAALCNWIEQEQGLEALANKLRRIRMENGSLEDFVFAIEQEVSYASPQVLTEMKQEFFRFEEKPDLERKKLRIDQMVQKKKYCAAIEAYHQLLLAQEELDGILLGSIWHNLGTAYARMFLFQEASLCYRTAYEWNQKEISKKEYLLSVWCMQSEPRFKQATQAYCMSQEEEKELLRQIAIVKQEDEILNFKQQLEALFQLKKQGRMEAFEKDYSEMIAKWKSEYRRICKK